ncbi:Sensor protein KdpD [compost metagenome]
MGRLLDGTCGIVLRDKDDKLSFDDNKSYNVTLKDKERAVAVWAFESGKMAGWSTDTLAEAKNLYIPLKGSVSTVGVFVYRANKKRKLTLEQENLLHTILNQLANSLEKRFLEKRLREAERLEESEELHQTLLNSISHELRTPLTVIMGTASAFSDPIVQNDPAQIAAMGQELSFATERLNRIIENLLDMSRLSSGVLALKKEYHDIHDLVGVTLGKLKGFLSKHQVKVQISDDFPLVEMDFRLMEHALMNLVINATMYTPANSEIVISAKHLDGFVSIEVTDNGPGVPEDSLPFLFDKFYRVPGSKTGGTGLGLSIVKSIVDAHKGQVEVENIQPHGARFTLTLPYKKIETKD